MVFFPSTRAVQDRARQGFALRALLRQRRLQQFPPRHALQALWPANEGQEHVRGDGHDDHQHHRAAGGESRHLLAVLAQLQVRTHTHTKEEARRVFPPDVT